MGNILRVSIVGAGTMGVGIAISAIGSGAAVTLIDSNRGALEQAKARLEKYLGRQIDKQKMSAEEAKTHLSRFDMSTDLQAVASSDILIEAVFEDLDVKRSVYGTLEPIISADTLIATNTSALKVTDLAANLACPERFCGIHYFSPAEVNPIAEVVRGTHTSDKTIETALAFLKSCNKQPIECADQSGFALNRFFCPYTNEAARCLDDRLATASQIDEVARQTFSLALGPFAVMNIVKPRINLAAVRNLEPLGPFYQPAESLRRCGEADESWDLSDDGALPDSGNLSIVSDRLKGAVFYAVLEELSEDVATPQAIDLGARGAFRFEKGPVELMRDYGEAEVKRLIGLVQPGRENLTDALF